MTGRSRRMVAAPVGTSVVEGPASDAPSSRPRRPMRRRAHNAALVLRALYDLGPISRADIARLTGLTRTSVGELVSDLEKDGLAIDVGLGPSTGGKQPTSSRQRTAPDDHHARPRRAYLHCRARQPARRARRAHQPRPRGRDGDEAVEIVHELIDEVRRAATTPSSASVSEHRASSTSRGRSAGRSASTGRTCLWPRSSNSATGCRPSSPTTAAPPPSPRTCSAATPGPRTRRDQGGPRHRRRADPQGPAVRRRR